MRQRPQVEGHAKPHGIPEQLRPRTILCASEVPTAAVATFVLRRQRSLRLAGSVSHQPWYRLAISPGIAQPSALVRLSEAPPRGLPAGWTTPDRGTTTRHDTDRDESPTHDTAAICSEPFCVTAKRAAMRRPRPLRPGLGADQTVCVTGSHPIRTGAPLNTSRHLPAERERLPLATPTKRARPRALPAMPVTTTRNGSRRIAGVRRRCDRFRTVLRYR